MVQEESNKSSDGSVSSAQPGTEPAPSNTRESTTGGTPAAPPRRQNFYIPRLQESQGQTESSNLPPDLRKMAQKADFVERTKLDHIVLKDVVKKSFEEQAIKISEQMKAQAAEPPKPFKPIDNYRQASPCSSACAAGAKKEKVTFCEKCHLQVYDFTGMEFAEAEELIFKRENKRGIVLYKRQDGRFLTADCPVGANQRKQLIMAVAAGILLAVLGIAAAVLAPRPPQQASLPSEPPTTDQSANQSVPAQINQQANPPAYQPPASTGYYPSPQPQTNANNSQASNDEGPSSAWRSSAQITPPATEPAQEFDSDVPPDIVNSNSQQGQESGAPPATSPSASPPDQQTTAPQTSQGTDGAGN